MLNNSLLEDARKAAVQSTSEFCKTTGLDHVYVFGRHGVITIYEDKELKNSVSQTALDKLSSKFELIAKHYNDVNLDKCVEVKLNGHDVLDATNKWQEWEELANNSCLSSSDT